MSSLETILDTLGGNKSVAHDLGCGVSAVCNWKTRGIPPGRKLDLLSLADAKAVKLTIAEIQAADAAIMHAKAERERG